MRSKTITQRLAILFGFESTITLNVIQTVKSCFKDQLASYTVDFMAAKEIEWNVVKHGAM